MTQRKQTPTSNSKKELEVIDSLERAHNEDGTFKADNPATPEVNEAYKPEKRRAPLINKRVEHANLKPGKPTSQSFGSVKSIRY